MKKHYRHESDCLNCGAKLEGIFCHRCGQENLEMKESFGHMINHAVSDYFHFDYQFFHTLRPLIFKPGLLTAEYLRGRRAQYLHPVKMYIFISLVYFVLLFQNSHKEHRAENPDKTTKSEISGGRKTGTARDADSGDHMTVSAYLADQKDLPDNMRDGFWERFYTTTWLGYKEKYGSAAVEMFKEDIRHNIPKMMFALLPLLALILKITYWRDRRLYVEYLIYAIHLHCFYFLSQSLLLGIELILPVSLSIAGQALTLLLFLYTVYYIYRSLRLLYRRRRWVTVRKMLTMSIMYLIMFITCMFGLIMVIAARA